MRQMNNWNIAPFFVLALTLLVSAAMPAAADGKAKQDGSKVGELADGACGYQIVRASENMVWRLNTATGEVSACTFENDAMVCGSSDGAVMRPSSTLDELKRERGQQREEDLAFIERLLEMAMRWIGKMDAMP